MKYNDLKSQYHIMNINVNDIYSKLHNETQYPQMTTYNKFKCNSKF